MDREGVVAWLKLHGVNNYTIDEDLSVDVNGDVDLSFSGLGEIKVRFRNVSGSFHCYDNGLTSLLGCPVSVGRHFSCHDNRLKTLEYCPVEVVGDFFCNANRLTSLEGCPEYVGGRFETYGNKLIDSDIFLYDYTSEQIGQYYKNKKLNEDLKENLSEDIGVETKKKKI